MRKFGLHLRAQHSLSEVAIKAQSVNLKIFQNFLINTLTGRYIKITDSDIKNFLQLRQNFDELYLHASFWINLCSELDGGVRLLKREIELAKKFEYTHLILHPGSAKSLEDPIQGIDYFAKRLNQICAKERDIKIVLENTAHGKKTIGSNLADFKIIQEKLDFEVFYCLDTAHAYAQGYNLNKSFTEFISDIEKYMGISNVVLVHLNDSMSDLDSKLDKHAAPGEGMIGLDALKNFIKMPQFITKNVILELPDSMNTEDSKSILHEFL